VPRREPLAVCVSTSSTVAPRPRPAGELGEELAERRLRSRRPGEPAGTSVVVTSGLVSEARSYQVSGARRLAAAEPAPPAHHASRPRRRPAQEPDATRRQPGRTRRAPASPPGRRRFCRVHAHTLAPIARSCRPAPPARPVLLVAAPFHSPADAVPVTPWNSPAASPVSCSPAPRVELLRRQAHQVEIRSRDVNGEVNTDAGHVVHPGDEVAHRPELPTRTRRRHTRPASCCPRRARRGRQQAVGARGPPHRRRRAGHRHLARLAGRQPHREARPRLLVVHRLDRAHLGGSWRWPCRTRAAKRLHPAAARPTRDAALPGSLVGRRTCPGRRCASTAASGGRARSGAGAPATPDP